MGLACFLTTPGESRAVGASSVGMKRSAPTHRKFPTSTDPRSSKRMEEEKEKRAVLATYLDLR